jgi:hypothetical protein
MHVIILEKNFLQKFFLTPAENSRTYQSLENSRKDWNPAGTKGLDSKITA